MRTDDFWSEPAAIKAIGEVRNPKELDEYWSKFLYVKRTDVDKMIFAGLPLDLKILEVGCGVGNQLEVLHQMGFTDLSGLDLNSEAIRIADKLRSYLQLFHGNGGKLPFADGRFDLVFTANCLNYIDTYATVMEEMLRVSRIWVAGYEAWAPTLRPLPSNLSLDGKEVENMSWSAPRANLFADLLDCQPERLWRCARKFPEGRFDEAYLFKKPVL